MVSKSIACCTYKGCSSKEKYQKANYQSTDGTHSSVMFGGIGGRGADMI